MGVDPHPHPRIWGSHRPGGFLAVDWLDQATLKAPRQSLCREKDPGAHKIKILIAHEQSDHRPSCLSFPRTERS